MRDQPARRSWTFSSRPAGAAVLLAAALVAAAAPISAQSRLDGPILVAARRAAARLDARATASQAPPLQRSWMARHPVATGALIGTAAGAALSRVDAIGGHGHDSRVAFLGTAVGAWGGLIGSAVLKARRGERVGTGTKIGMAAGAVAAVVLPLLACYGAGGCGGVS